MWRVEPWREKTTRQKTKSLPNEAFSYWESAHQPLPARMGSRWVKKTRKPGIWGLERENVGACVSTAAPM